MDKRYLLFLCESYYPMCGVNDLKGCFTKDELIYLLKNNLNKNDELEGYDYMNLFDLKTMSPIINRDEDYKDDEGYMYETFNFEVDEDYGDIERLIKIINNEK